MFKSMKRIIKWAGKYKGTPLSWLCFFLFSAACLRRSLQWLAAYALDKAIAAYWAGNTIESS